MLLGGGRQLDREATTTEAGINDSIKAITGRHQLYCPQHCI